MHQTDTPARPTHRPPESASPDRSASALSPVGFIGLGAMGSRIATRLLDAGHLVYATNRTAAKAEPLLERGLLWCATPREVAASAGVVLSMVTDDDALDAISERTGRAARRPAAGRSTST